MSSNIKALSGSVVSLIDVSPCQEQFPGYSVYFKGQMASVVLTLRAEPLLHIQDVTQL